MNLIEGLQEELKRNRELRAEYDKIPTGVLGARFIQADIATGEHAIATGDTVAMLKAYEALRNNE